jgi:hypothetical protein
MESMAAIPEFGAPAEELTRILETPLPQSPPPLPDRNPFTDPSIMKVMAESSLLDEKVLGNIDVSRVIGPFIRCREVFVAEWMAINDVPDITFRVTQDIDGDGIEEDIYSEGFFDIRWNAPYYPYIMNVVLEASANAVCVPICVPPDNPVEEIPCVDKPTISLAGVMTLEDTHHNRATGYGRRVNRPADSSDPKFYPGRYPPPPSAGSGGNTAVSPYTGTLNLFGCYRIGDATHYRFTYVLDGTGSPAPIKGQTWWAPRAEESLGGPIHVVPDTEGWYEIQDADTLDLAQWALNWNTPMFSDGAYELRLEVGKLTGGAISVMDVSDPCSFVVDNKVPDAGFLEIRWRYANVTGPWNDSNSTLLPVACPVINRDKNRDVKVRVRWQASATHLRDARIWFGGCGSGVPQLLDSDPMYPPPGLGLSPEELEIAEYRHWHVNRFDNAVLKTCEYLIPKEADPGCYTLRICANSRAFNPSGSAGEATVDWLTNRTWRWRWVYRAISVVNA